jgi:bacillithiol biosynthesis cysteine-adding enzyme BshC
MHCSSVRQSDLPNTTRLFADVLYHPERTAPYYSFPARDLESFRAAAAQIEFPDERRQALIAALRVQNQPSPALERLAQPGTVAVMSGQQVGLFSGPCYTIYKVLHAVKLAQWLSENGVPAVPVFWLATEDHDFAEVNHVWVFGASQTPEKLELRRAAGEQPVGGVALVAPPVEELRTALHGLPFGEEIADMVEETYRGGSTMGKAFGEMLRRLLAKFDVLLVDPMLPEFRELAAPALRKAVAAAPELTQAVLARNQALAADGYHAQVHVEEQTSFFFLLENGKRLGLRRSGDEYVQNSRRFSGQELMERAASLSPNALLRPVIQDSMLPTVAYIGGPAEVAYFAQSAVLYEAVLGRMPVVVPRAGFTILDGRSCKLMGRYKLTLPDFFHGEPTLHERIASTLVPPDLTLNLREAASSVKGAVKRLRTELAAFDPTLVQALDRSGSKIAYQMEKMERKTGREAMRRDERAAKDAAALYALIYPERHLQERIYSILPFLARHGMGLLDDIFEAIELQSSEHQLMIAG